MKLSGNTILITGGGSGIGLALAEEFKKLGNEVIVAGRSKEKLQRAEAIGLKTLTVDMTSEESIQACSQEATSKFPSLNVVIHNAGIMMNEKVTKPEAAKVAKDTVLTNLLGPIFLNTALLPHLLTKPEATIMTVTSGLAYLPLAMTPTYSATKAAIHSYTMALRYQLKDTHIEVKELVPPYVRTHLMGERQATDQNAMPLEDFISEVMSILKTNPQISEIVVKNALPLRSAGDNGSREYQELFTQRNDLFMGLRKAEWDRL